MREVPVMWPKPAELDQLTIRFARVTSGSVQLLQHPGSVSLPANDEWAQRVEGPRYARPLDHTLRVDPASGVYLRVSPIQFVELNRFAVGVTSSLP